MSLSGAMYSIVPQMEGSTSSYFAMSPKSLKTILTECKTGYNVSQVGYYLVWDLDGWIRPHEEHPPQVQPARRPAVQKKNAPS